MGPTQHQLIEEIRPFPLYDIEALAIPLLTSSGRPSSPLCNSSRPRSFSKLRLKYPAVTTNSVYEVESFICSSRRFSGLSYPPLVLGSLSRSNSRMLEKIRSSVRKMLSTSPVVSLAALYRLNSPAALL